MNSDNTDVVNIDEWRQRREPGYELVLSFDTDDPEFARGVEVGRLWELTRDGVSASLVQAHNRGMVERIAVARGIGVDFELTDDPFWLVAKFNEAGS